MADQIGSGLGQNAVRRGRRAYTIPEFMAEFDVSRATVYREASPACGRLKLTKIRSKSVITIEDAERWWAACQGAVA